MDVAKINPNFNSKTFFLDTKSSKKERIKNSPAKDVFVSCASIGAGGILGNQISQKIIKKNEASINLKLDEIKQQLNEFLSKSTQENAAGAVSKNPYKDMTLLMDKTLFSKENPYVEMPNCLLFLGQDKAKTKGIMDWFIHANQQRYLSFDMMNNIDNFADFLEENEKQYQKTKIWNFVYAKDLDKLISTDSDKSDIAMMKSVMCRCADDFHTTLLFQTKDLKTLDDTAIESYRVSRCFDTDNMPDFSEYKSMINKFNTLLDELRNIVKNKKQILLKGTSIGILAGILASITAIFTVRKFMQNKENNNENKQ